MVLWSWGGAFFIFLSLLSQTWIDVKINEWYKGFYDLLTKSNRKRISEFYDGIISVYEISNSLCNYLYSYKLFY